MPQSHLIPPRPRQFASVMRAQAPVRRAAEARPGRRRHGAHAARARRPRDRGQAPALRIRRRARPRRPPPARPHLPPGLVDLQAGPAHPRRRRRRCSRPASGRPTTSRTSRSIVVACVRGRRPVFPAIGAAAFYGARSPPSRTCLLAARPAGSGAGVTTLPLWSTWEARRTLGLPRRSRRWRSSRSAGHAVRPEPTPVPPVGNLVHLDRYGHQPFPLPDSVRGANADMA